MGLEEVMGLATLGQLVSTGAASSPRRGRPHLVYPLPPPAQIGHGPFRDFFMDNFCPSFGEGEA